ncbi:hypothetical protein OUZ56_011533 [Daphnia magna]|uniref:Uncharacterized protein n=1 Tax=Daphnia magna TaxID=35525 RepID=A0ABQ9Z0L6_9CRUS|nr:hypothetical protein OUZ56_011533 [Daphnia magna]
MSGVVFQNLGEVNFSDSEWVVVTEVSFRQVEATLGHLGQWLAEKLTQHEGVPLNEDFKIATDRELEELSKHLDSLSKETSGIVSTLAEQAILVNESLWELHKHTVVLGQMERAHQTLEKELNRAKINFREGRWGDGHIGQGWVLRFKAINHINSSPHLDLNTDLEHHIQKRYAYAIDSDGNIYRQLELKLNCFGKQHYQAQALNFQLSF